MKIREKYTAIFKNEFISNLSDSLLVYFMFRIVFLLLSYLISSVRAVLVYILPGKILAYSFRGIDVINT